MDRTKSVGTRNLRNGLGEYRKRRTARDAGAGNRSRHRRRPVAVTSGDVRNGRGLHRDGALDREWTIVSAAYVETCAILSSGVEYHGVIRLRIRNLVDENVAMSFR